MKKGDFRGSAYRKQNGRQGSTWCRCTRMLTLNNILKARVVRPLPELNPNPRLTPKLQKIKVLEA